jgi:mono/diheme cytochrome c family protein
MRGLRRVVAWPFVLGFICLVRTQGAAEVRQNFATEVHAVFAARCAGCHGSDLAHPEGRFGYVLDLSRLAANPELVIPTSPQESELWEVVHRDEMPPRDSPTGPLSVEEKETIRSWIAAGAQKLPAPLPDAAQKPAGVQGAAKRPTATEVKANSSSTSRRRAVGSSCARR